MKSNTDRLIELPVINSTMANTDPNDMASRKTTRLLVKGCDIKHIHEMPGLLDCHLRTEQGSYSIALTFDQLKEQLTEYGIDLMD